MTKRGQGLPLNVIILAVLGLIVLIVLSVIMIGRTATFSRQAEEQQEQVGKSVCAKPGADRICSATAPTEYLVECKGPFGDCGAKCFAKSENDCPFGKV